MKPTKRLLKYSKEHYGEVMHTTLNPEGPGVVRIHLIPPKFSDDDIAESIAIINGQDIIPVGTSWSVILCELIRNVNRYSGQPINDEDVANVIDETVKAVKKVFPFVSKKKIKEDILKIMTTFKQVAYGQIPAIPIGYLSMGEYARYMNAPHRMDLMVSAMTVDGKWHCNQKCVHCYAAGQEHSNEEELSTDKWIKIIDILRDEMVPQVTFTGGEPTMREDLFELIEHAKWFVTRLNTNGIKLTKEYCEKLKEVSLDSVQITFYSSDEDIHNKLVGSNQYINTVNGIINAVETGLNVSVNTPLCTLNKDYKKTLEFLHEKGVIYVTCSGLITTGNATLKESEDLQLTKDDIKAVLKEAVEYCYANGMEISFTSPGWIEKEFFEELKINTPTCGACLSNMAITPSGNIVPCQSWLSGKSMGNILIDKWDDVWNSHFCVDRRNYSAFMLGECPLRISKDTIKSSAVDTGAEEKADTEKEDTVNEE